MYIAPHRQTPPNHIVAEVRAWVDRAVIGLQLCPFAKAVQVKGLVDYVVTDATDATGLRAALVCELRRLAQAPCSELDTIVLVHPWAMQAFADFIQFLDEADAAIADLGFSGEIQLASFHPDYRFAGTAEDDIGNATNRAPYPILHLLREASIDAAVAAFPDAESIYETNIATMERLGPEGWAALQRQCREDADAAVPDGSASEPRAS
jgi:hypothetical protein